MNSTPEEAPAGNARFWPPSPMSFTSTFRDAIDWAPLGRRWKKVGLRSLKWDRILTVFKDKFRPNSWNRLIEAAMPVVDVLEGKGVKSNGDGERVYGNDRR